MRSCNNSVHRKFLQPIELLSDFGLKRETHINWMLIRNYLCQKVLLTLIVCVCHPNLICPALSGFFLLKWAGQFCINNIWRSTLIWDLNWERLNFRDLRINDMNQRAQPSPSSVNRRNLEALRLFLEFTIQWLDLKISNWTTILSLVWYSGQKSLPSKQHIST